VYMRSHPALIAVLLCVCLSAAFADDRIPTGTLRATYIATNPVQASVDRRGSRPAHTLILAPMGTTPTMTLASSSNDRKV